jgi:hypothetical protein
MITHYFLNKTSVQSFLKKSTVSYIYKRREYLVVLYSLNQTLGFAFPGLGNHYCFEQLFSILFLIEGRYYPLE